MKLSFGMIFSIMLIIVFIGFAIYIIANLISFQKNLTTNSFFKNFQEDVDSMWRGAEGSTIIKYSLPSKAEKVCFVDFSSPPKNNRDLYYELQLFSSGEKNLFVYPISETEGSPGRKINHLNIAEITKIKNPYCIEVENGKVEIEIIKEFGEELVKIK